MANKGGFSWKRALGVTKAKQDFARKTGIPTTKAGRKRKAERMVFKAATGGGCLIPSVFVFVLFLTLFIGSFSAFAQDNIQVVIDGNQLQMEVEPVIENGRTLVPLRAIFEALGATIAWDEETETITAHKDSITLSIQIGNMTVIKNGESIIYDTSPMIIDGRTMVPVRMVAESLETELTWDESTKTVMISTDNSTAPALPPVIQDIPATQNASDSEISIDKYVGSKDSNKYHYPNCRHAENILTENLIGFTSAQDAQTSGYEPCGVCKPPTQD